MNVLIVDCYTTALSGLGAALWLLGGPLVAADRPGWADCIPTGDGDLTIQPINHATLLLQLKDKTIYVDPVGGAKAFAGLTKPDLILVTHLHADHFNVETLAAVAGPATKLVAPPTVAEQFPAKLRERTTVLTNGQSQELLGILVKAVPAYNLTPERLRFHPKGRDNGYLVTLGGKRIYLSGDTEAVPEMLALKNISVAFLCMNLPYTMDVAQAAQAVKVFKPRIVYPYHCRNADLAKFKELVGAASGSEVRLRDWYGSKP